MRLNKRFVKVMLAAVVCWMLPLAGGGCGNAHQRHTAQGERNWRAARAGVMGNLAKEQYENGSFEQARESIDKAIQLFPEACVFHILSARIAIEEGRLEAAEKSLTEARRLDPRNADADYLSGVVSQRWQKLEQAYEFYSAATEKQPQELAFLLAQAETLVSLDRTDEALALLQSKVIYFEHSPTIRDAVAQLLMTKGKFQEAADMFRQASILASDDSSIKERLAMACLRSKRYNDAVDTLTRLLKDKEFSERGDLFIALGEAQMQLGRTRDARASFDSATQFSPNDATAWLSLGRAAMQLNDLKRAEMSVRRSISLDPSNSEAYLLSGYVRLKQDKLDEALAAFRKASAIDENDTVSVCMVGYVLEKKGNSEEALKQYDRALKMKPGDELATRLMAEVQLNQ